MPSEFESSSTSEHRASARISALPRKIYTEEINKKAIVPSTITTMQMPILKNADGKAAPESDDRSSESLIIPTRISRIVRRKSSSTIAEREQKAAIDVTRSPPVLDDEDSAMIRAMTPSKRRRPTFPESPFVEPGRPVAESSAIDGRLESSQGTRRSRKKLVMGPTADMPDIQIRRTRTASYVVSSITQAQPQAAAIGRRRSSSSRTGSSVDLAKWVDLDETDHLITWDDDSDDEFMDIILKMDAIKFKSKGKDFDALKPINDNGLFHHVVFNYMENQARIREWIDLFKDGSELEATCEILQLFTDLMGLQHIKVHSVYKTLHFDKSTVHPVVQHIRDLETQNDARYFLLACSKQWSKGVRNAFHAFFAEFIGKCYVDSTILYAVSTQLSYFLTHAMDSRQPLELLTSTLIMVFMMNTFLDILVGIKIQNGEEYENKMLVWMEKMVGYYFDLICDANIVTKDLHDIRFVPIRLEVLHFLKYWIHRRPSLFVCADQTYCLLKTLLVDEKDLVRKEAMNCCLKIVSTDRMHLNMNNFELLLFVIIKRCEDCDLAVASMAIQCYTKAIERFPVLISKQIKIPTMVMCHSMLSKDFIIRKQAFLNLCVSIKLSHLTPKEFFVAIAKTVEILNNNEKYTVMLFLVETLYSQSVPEILNLELILEVIYSEMEKREYAYYLLQIFCNSAEIQYLGYLENIGEYARKDWEVPDLTVKRKVTKIVLRQFEAILERFDECEVICILKTLNVFTIETLQIMENAQIIKRLPQLLIKTFLKYNDGEVLQEITKFFVHCMTADGFVRRYFTSNVKDLCKFVTNFPDKYQYDISDGISEQSFADRTLKNERLLEKLHSLVMHVNFMEYTTLAWTHIHVNWNNSKNFLTAKITTLQIECCQHYLIWHLKQIVADKYNDAVINEEVENLNINSTQYIRTLISLLQSRTAKCSVKNTVFECLCHLHINFNQVIKAVPEEQRQEYREKLSLNNLPDDIASLVCTFVANKMESAMQAKSTNELERLDLVDRIKQYISYLLCMFRLGIMNLINDHYILRYFNDELFIPYGELFIWYLDNVIKDTEGTGLPAMEQVMYRTLKNVIFSNQKDNLPSIIRQFKQYLRKRGFPCSTLVDYIIRFAALKQGAAIELIPLAIPLLDIIPMTQLKNVVKKRLDEEFHDKKDPNIHKFHLKLISCLPKDSN